MKNIATHREAMSFVQPLSDFEKQSLYPGNVVLVSSQKSKLFTIISSVSCSSRGYFINRKPFGVFLSSVIGKLV
jgi:hypothetical protein